jgi:septum formation protein
LERLQLSFDIISPNIDETALPNETPHELVIRLAKEKALKSATEFPDALIIGADQVGVLDNHILGKPLTYENAFKQLQQASGKRMQFLIGLCLYDSQEETYQLTVEEFTVTYRQLTSKMIENYLKKEQPLACAGACQAEGLGIALIEQFEGQDFTALIGLPLIRLVSMLEKAGMGPLG